MKFYRHDPDAFIAGTTELNWEQRGAYISLLDLLYSRDGMVPDDDAVVARMLQVDPRRWRRMKNELMVAGKVRVNAGLLTANGVDRTRLLTEVRSKSARHSANVRWENYRKAKENNDRLMLERSAPIRQSNNSVPSSSLEDRETPPVDDGDNDFGNPAKSTTKSIGSRELKATLRDKGWI